jgi:hypothetical protein
MTSPRPWCESTKTGAEAGSNRLFLSRSRPAVPRSTTGRALLVPPTRRVNGRGAGKRLWVDALEGLLERGEDCARPEAEMRIGDEGGDGAV